LIERGIASARLLQSAALRQKLLATDKLTTATRIQKLTAGLPAANVQLEAILKQRRASYSAAIASVERGRLQFTKHCAACHQVQGQGAVVGPQLDGVGNRGLERILEDVLDPNRNLDAAFHVSVLAMNDGRVLTGLFRRKEGKSLVFAANDGKEFSVLEAEIDEHHKSSLSIMPDNMSTVLQPADFNDLIKYLLSLRQPARKTTLKPEP
jgi:putative heme-binding domain-containing protein